MSEQLLTFDAFAVFTLRRRLQPPIVLVERQHPPAS